MKMKVFISSEMNQAIDLERRKAARNEMTELGFVSHCFEDLPGRRNPDDLDTREMCIELVRESDLFLAIVDDTVTDVMESEINEAFDCLGENRIFFYFAKSAKRDQKAKALWNKAKKSWVIKEFEDTGQLTREVSHSMASFVADALEKVPKIPEKSLDAKVILAPGESRSWRLVLKKGDIVTITCTSDSTLTPFKAGFYSREEYFDRKPKGLFQMFNFGRVSEKPHFTERRKITRNDDYYFIIRAAWFVIITAAKIKVEIKVE